MQSLLAYELPTASNRKGGIGHHRRSNVMLKPKAMCVIGAKGNRLTEDDLPRPSTKRWSNLQKANVVAAVEGGLISRYEACRRYELSVEEYLTWKDIIMRFGIEGLRASQSQAVWNATPH
jgi:hypothetical protein